MEATNLNEVEPEDVPKPQVLPNIELHRQAPVSKPQVIYRCRKCRRIVATQETEVPHEQGKGWHVNKTRTDCIDSEKEAVKCSSIFVEPMNWMEKVQEGYVGSKLQCMGCKARLGSFNWAGMQCNCGTWVTPAFQLHKNRLDECHG